MSVYCGSLVLPKQAEATNFIVKFPDGPGAGRTAIIASVTEGEADHKLSNAEVWELESLTASEDLAVFRFGGDGGNRYEATVYRRKEAITLALTDPFGNASPPATFVSEKASLPIQTDIFPDATTTVVNDLDGFTAAADGKIHPTNIYSCVLTESDDNISGLESLSNATGVFFGAFGIGVAAALGSSKMPGSDNFQAGFGISFGVAAFGIPILTNIISKLFPDTTGPRVCGAIGYGQSLQRTATKGMGPTNTLTYTYATLEEGNPDKLVFRMGQKTQLGDGIFRLSSLKESDSEVLLSLTLSDHKGKSRFENKAYVLLNTFRYSGPAATEPYNQGDNIRDLNYRDSLTTYGGTGYNTTSPYFGNINRTSNDGIFSLQNNFYMNAGIMIDLDKIDPNGTTVFSLPDFPDKLFYQMKGMAVTGTIESGIALKAAGNLAGARSIIQQLVKAHPDGNFRAFTWRSGGTVNPYIDLSGAVRSNGDNFNSGFSSVYTISDPLQYVFLPVSQINAFQVLK
jgi:hypothetical protein